MATELFFPSERSLEDVVTELFTDRIKGFISKLRGIDEYNIMLAIEHDLSAMSLFRQTPLGEYGKLDLLTISEFLPHNGDAPRLKIANVIELKNVPLTHEDVNQALRYRQALIEMGRYSDVRCVLIGPSSRIDDSFILRELRLQSILFAYTYSMTYEGLRFEPVPEGKYFNEKYTTDVFMNHLLNTHVATFEAPINETIQ